MTNSTMTRGAWRGVLDVTASALVIVAAIVVILSFVRGGATAGPAPRPEPPLPTAPVRLDAALRLGDPNAPAVLLEFADFQCPYCGAFDRDTFPGLSHRYVKPGQLQVIFVNEPLPMHQHAEKAAEAAVCAAQQGKGWEMHDALFADQQHLDEPSLVERAISLGLDRGRFDSCLNGSAATRVKAESSEASQVQAKGTPSFLVGTLTPDGRLKAVKRISGNRPASDFYTAIDAVLKSAGRN